MSYPEKSRQLVPVFIEQVDGQDVRSLLYVRDGKGGFTSLAELQSSSQPEDSAEIPGVLTTSIVETPNAARGTTVKSVSVSPFRLCCYYSGGIKICFIC